MLELFNDMEIRNVLVKRMGLPDKFIEHGPLPVLREKYGLDEHGILKTARALLQLG